VTEGTNTIVGTDPAVILSEARKILAGTRGPARIPDLWDGSAASRIVDILEHDLGSGS
jgi:UDP-N-acetylglucosamine 2-epimerase (non-hydrolysing)